MVKGIPTKQEQTSLFQIGFDLKIQRLNQLILSAQENIKVWSLDRAILYREAKKNGLQIKEY